MICNTHALVPFLVATTLILAQPQLAKADTVLITGANSGIGLEFARQYAAKGWTVIATHRRPEPPRTLTDLAAKYNKVRIEKLDVTSVEQVNALATRLADTPIDVLINNAGVYNDRAKCAADDDLCPGDWTTDRRTPTARPGAIFYRMSKAALNREMQIVAASTRKDGVTVVMLNPGPTLTEHQEYLKSYKGMLKTSFIVENMIATIGKVTIADTGRFLRYDGATEPW